jgi:Flp pilus assembly protein TadG
VGRIFKLKRKFYNQKGQVAVMVALLLAAFVGMLALVVDVGSMYEDKSSLQGVADAAALAGAQELPGTKADILVVLENFIDSYNTSNGTNLSVEIGNGDDIIDLQSFPTVGGVPNTMLTVTVTNSDSPIYFGNAVPDFGKTSVAARATATAVVGSPLEYPAVPWGLLDAGQWNDPNPNPVTGEPIRILFGVEYRGGSALQYRELTDTMIDPLTGETNYFNGFYFDALDIDGSGSAVNYMDALVNGTPLSIDTQVSALANVVDETYQGLETRIMQQPHGNASFGELDTDLVNTVLSPYSATLVRGDSQLIIIPVIYDWPPDNDPIQYFRPFILTGCEIDDAVPVLAPFTGLPVIDPDTGLPLTTRAVFVSGMFLSEAFITTNGDIGPLVEQPPSPTTPSIPSIIKVIRLVPNPD